MTHLYAVETAEELSAYQAFVRSVDKRLQDYIVFLKTEYAAKEFPQTILWTSSKTATEVISDIPVPAYTNERRIVFAPDVEAWRKIYLAQMEGLSGTDADFVRAYYNNALTEHHILQILGHELAHHSSYFPDSDYESDIWFEEGMAEYISRQYFLTNEEFETEAKINRMIVEQLMPKYGNHSLEEFGAETYSRNYAGIFFEYWRSFLSVKEIVDTCGGDSRKAIMSFYKGKV